MTTASANTLVVEVRAVGGHDAARLRDIRLRALADAPAAFAVAADEEAARPEAEWETLARDSERAESVVVYAAVAGDRWMGMAAGRWYDSERGIAHLWGMWVDPALRGHGVGERLVGAVSAWASARGGRLLRLGVITAEGDATPFYEHLGFSRSGEVAPLRRDPARVVHYLVRPL
jgi:GNAT superfamily N-acetyltransferase